MAPDWANAEIASAEWTANVYGFVIFLLCMALGYFITWRIISRESGKGNFTLQDFTVAILLGCMYAALPLSVIIVYFGIPKGLTFGFQIGQVLPASCEASIPVEGHFGLPCCLKDRLAGVTLSNKCERTLNPIRELTFLYAVVAILLVFVTRHARLREQARELEEESEKMSMV